MSVIIGIDPHKRRCRAPSACEPALAQHRDEPEAGLADVALPRRDQERVPLEVEPLLDEFTDRRVGAGVNTRTGGDLGDQCGQGSLGHLARALHGPADVAVPTLHRVAASRDAQRRRYAS
jgi:hypothetical protein